MIFYRENSEIRNGIDPGLAEIKLRGKIVVGTFSDVERPDFLQNYQTNVVSKVLAKGDKPGKGRAA